MKLVWATIIGLALSMGTAQQTPRSFLDVLNYSFRVAQTPCPAAFSSLFTEPQCYLHGYDDFFDFKMRYGQFFSEPGRGRIAVWHTVLLELGNESATAFRSRQTLRLGRSLTVTYLETFIVLEFSP